MRAGAHVRKQEWIAEGGWLATLPLDEKPIADWAAGFLVGRCQFSWRIGKRKITYYLEINLIVRINLS
jgi:hypothetical protein